MNDQRSTYDQVSDLHAIAIERGMYDAADWIEAQWPAITYLLEPDAPSEEATNG